ncbi:MAG: hypothetical protein M0Z59_05655 [Nitrospiraceae bacterium]|nr:hypothetical protein [Nitrospiraceae bacterium]
MDASRYYELFRFLMRQYCHLEEDIEFVPDIKGWSEQHGMGADKADEARLLKFIPEDSSGCMLLVRKDMPEELVNERINALRMRSQMIKSVRRDWADLLDTPHKRLAYFFLSEFALALPETGGDAFRADEWAIGEMHTLGYIKPQDYERTP